MVDYTNIPIHMKELMFVKITNCSDKDVAEIFRIAQVFHIGVIDYSRDAVLLESVQEESKNDNLIAYLNGTMPIELKLSEVEVLQLRL